MSKDIHIGQATVCWSDKAQAWLGLSYPTGGTVKVGKQRVREFTRRVMPAYAEAKDYCQRMADYLEGV